MCLETDMLEREFLARQIFQITKGGITSARSGAPMYEENKTCLIHVAYPCLSAHMLLMNVDTRLFRRNVYV